MRALRVLVAAVAAVALLTNAGPAIAQDEPATRDFESTGIFYLQENLDLQSVPVNQYADSQLRVRFTQPGIYDLDYNVRGAISGRTPFGALIVVRLWNETTSSVVGGSERMVVHVIDRDPADLPVGANDTIPISERITVDGVPTTIVLQAMRFVRQPSGNTTAAWIFSNPHGRTSVRVLKVHP